MPWPRGDESSTVVSAISRPRPTTMRCSAVRAISLIRCEETNTVRPSAASSLSRVRIHRMPSGSRPLTGSSRMSVCGSPSSAAAMPSRCPMPSENPPARLPATAARPTISMTSSTRRAADAVVCGQRQQVVAGADRPVWTAAPPAARRPRAAARRARAYGVPLTRDRAAVGASSPRIIRIVVDLPAPLGPRNPVTMPGPDGERQAVDGDLVAVRLGEVLCDDHDDCRSSGWRNGSAQAPWSCRWGRAALGSPSR